MCARILALLTPISRAVANLRGETRPSSLASSSSPQPDTPGLAEQAFENGNAEYIKGNLDQAILDLSRAIELDPRDAISYTMRGAAYADKGDLLCTPSPRKPGRGLMDFPVLLLQRGGVLFATNEDEERQRTGSV